MRWLVLVHRYLGIAMCLLFAMWFASGIVMVFVPYPELTERERLATLRPLALSNCCVSPQRAYAASGLHEAPQRARLAMLLTRPVYRFHPWEGKAVAVYADSGERVSEIGATTALDVVRAARPLAQPSHVESADYDQWTVPNRFDADRPFHRIRLGDAAATELYVSQRSGEILRDTTAHERGWNYVGAVAHWIYPTVLRKDLELWDRVVWWLALIGIAGALSGIVLGIWRFRFRGKYASGRRSPFRGWTYGHHILGLGCALFVLAWIVSGWLSMDHGLLFSDPSPTRAQREHFAGGAMNLNRFTRALASAALPSEQGEPPREIELLQIDGAPLYRVRYDHRHSVLVGGREGDPGVMRALPTDFIARAAVGMLDAALGDAQTLERYDNYYYANDRSLALPGVRLTFADAKQTWVHIDPASGELLEIVPRDRRLYRWLYSGLHTLDFPFFQGRAVAWYITIVGLCALGLVFSITGTVIAWKRLRA